MKTPAIPAYFRAWFDKYKYLLLICLAGVILMLWPEGGQEEPVEGAVVSGTTAELEERLCALLEEMEGVGKARVLLTVEADGETDYAYDTSHTQTRGDSGDSVSDQSELVTLSESGGQTPVPLRTWSPQYRGAVVICQGGGSAAVRLAVTQVVQSLTGLTADRIVISKMKS